MTIIVILIILGILLFIAEVVLLPGVTLAAIGSFCCLVAAATLAFVWEGVTTGIIVLVIVTILMIVLTILLLRPKTWNRFALRNNIESQVQDQPIEQQIEVGVQAISLTRLAPFGTVEIEGKLYQARSLDSYIDPRREVVVIGYDNSNLIVKPK